MVVVHAGVWYNGEWKKSDLINPWTKYCFHQKNFAGFVD